MTPITIKHRRVTKNGDDNDIICIKENIRGVYFHGKKADIFNSMAICQGNQFNEMLPKIPNHHPLFINIDLIELSSSIGNYSSKTN